mgnify:CR=1 FL=1
MDGILDACDDLGWRAAQPWAAGRAFDEEPDHVRMSREDESLLATAVAERARELFASGLKAVAQQSQSWEADAAGLTRDELRAVAQAPSIKMKPGHVAKFLKDVTAEGGFGAAGRLLGVLDVDSDTPAAFDAVDQAQLEALCAELGTRFAATIPRCLCFRSASSTRPWGAGISLSVW